MNKLTTDPQSMQTFSFSSAKFRGALLQLSFNIREGKNRSWGWVGETGSGLSRGPAAATRCAAAQRKEKYLRHLRHLTSIHPFKIRSSVFPTSNTLVAMPYLGGTLCSRPFCCGHTTSPNQHRATAEPHAGRNAAGGHVPSNVLGTLVPSCVAAQSDASTPSSCTAGTQGVCKAKNTRTSCKRAGGR